MRDYPLSGYRSFVVSSLGPSTHPPRWVEERVADFADFQGKGNPRPEFNQSECAHLKGNMDIGLEGVRFESPVTTLLHDMIGDAPSGRFLT